MAATAAMDSPGFPESPMDGDEPIYMCKGCGEFLQEGKAFELAGNRWHIDCFRCNTCGTLLDSDANLLLLGDGSLICSSCTYSCTSCEKKIEDLAILTGDQAFCQSCFRCRQCKTVISDLKYARTSQGIVSQLFTGALGHHELTSALYCLSCHQILVSKRRKKSKSKSAKEKALPQLPRSAVDIDYLHDESTDLSASSTPQQRSPRTSTHKYKRDASPLGGSHAAYGDIPINLEELAMPTDQFPPGAGAIPRKQVPRSSEPSPQTRDDSRDYFASGARIPAKSASRDLAREDAEGGSSSDRERLKSSTHILSQDKGRLRKREMVSAGSSNASTPLSGPPFPSQPALQHSAEYEEILSQDRSPNPYDDPKRQEPVLAPSAVPARNADRGLPLRGDSLTRQTESPVPATPSLRRQSQSSSTPSTYTDSQGKTKPPSEAALPMRLAGLEGGPPPRSASRPRAQGGKADESTSRAPLPPPVAIEQHRHRNNASISTLQSEDPRASFDAQLSPSLLGSGFLKFESGFSLDDEMGRIMRGEKKEMASSAPTDDKSQSVLRRVSNAVKHGRSFSERSNSQMGKGSPLGSSFDISSPSTTTPTITSPAMDPASTEALRASLRRAQNTIAALEAEKLALEERLGGSGDISAVNTEIREKRSTMAILDTQRELAVRELEVLMDHAARHKDGHAPPDLASIKAGIVQDFTAALERLKAQMSSQIEDLMQKRNELTEEIGSLIQMKDKGFQEYENLSNKNSQLMQHNNELLRSIQGVYQDNRSPHHGSPGGPGLGIYGSGASQMSAATTAVDGRGLSLTHTDSLPQYEDGGDAALVGAPQVVNIRKATKPNKFNWRRGGDKLAKNMTKGFKGAFVQDKPANGQPPYSIGMPYAATQQAGPPDFMGSNGAKLVGPEETRAKAGFFGKNGAKLGNFKNTSNSNVAAEASVLFGSELSARCEYEGRLVPHIVAKCIAQVEARGMDVEGVYRKSGGAGQVKAVQLGFERDGADFDISDPDLDIHAVTSALKQYFRKLPTPLIVYEVYDRLLDAGQLSVAATDGMTSSTLTARNSKAALISALRAAIWELPEAHRNVLQFLLQHLANVMQHEPQNLMTPLNLAVVFAPTIMRPQSIEREMSDMQAQRIAVQALLEHQDSIFPEE